MVIKMTPAPPGYNCPCGNRARELSKKTLSELITETKGIASQRRTGLLVPGMPEYEKTVKRQSDLALAFRFRMRDAMHLVEAARIAEHYSEQLGIYISFEYKIQPYNRRANPLDKSPFYPLDE